MPDGTGKKPPIKKYPIRSAKAGDIFNYRKKQANEKIQRRLTYIANGIICNVIADTFAAYYSRYKNLSAGKQSNTTGLRR